MKRDQLVEAARGDRRLTMAITNVNLVNVFTCEIYPADIGIWQDRIAVVAPAGSEQLAAEQVVDGRGKWAVPGFVDTHVHIESSMVTPANFAAAVLPFGTTTVMIDPHEIGNVLGMDGVKYMLEASEGLPLQVLVTVPSCVPAVPNAETAGATFGPAEVSEMLAWRRVVGIGEVMDYPGVIAASARMSGIVEAGLEAGVTIQGHSPLLVGRGLDAYLAAGCESDHEIQTAEETLEKLRLGMLPLLRKSTYSNSIPQMAPVLKSLPFTEVAACTDDLEPAELLKNGHMNRVVREMIAQGIAPAFAIRYATLNGARHYGLRDLGAIAPGYFADIVLLEDLEEVRAHDVIVRGQVVVENTKLTYTPQEPVLDIPITNSVRIPELTADAFRLMAPAGQRQVAVRVMVTEPTLLTHLETVTAPVVGGEVSLDSLDGDICLLSVVSRHGQGGAPSLVPLKGLGLQRGAIASTISHDSHNLVVAGCNAEDMLLAVKALQACGGGLVAVADGRVLGQVALPIAGLMSPLPVAEVAAQAEAYKAVLTGLGVTGPRQLLALALLALAVIPFARLTNLGLVDVATQQILPVFA